MLLLEQGLVGIEGAIGIPLVILSQGEVAQVPLHLLLGMQVLLDSVHVQEYVDPGVVYAPVVSRLVQALSVKVA